MVNQLGAHVNFYKAHIEADLGVKGRLKKLGRQQWTSEKYLDLLRNSQTWREAVSEAEVVTIRIGSGDMFLQLRDYKLKTCGGEDNEDCIRAAAESFKENYEAIIAEILALCQSKTIIRTETYYYTNWVGYGFSATTRPFFEPLNDIIVQTASENNIPVALVHLVFNGPNGDQSALDTGYISDGGELPSEQGSKAMAELLRELGYESTCP